MTGMCEKWCISVSCKLLAIYYLVCIYLMQNVRSGEPQCVSWDFGTAGTHSVLA